MLFQREKELWRYASKNSAAVADGTTSQPPQPPPHRPRRHPQSSYTDQCCYQRPRRHHHQTPREGYFADLHDGSSTATQDCCSTPPPPYSSVPYGINCSDASSIQLECPLAAQQRPHFCADAAVDGDTAAEAEADITTSVTESELSFERRSTFSSTGCSCGSSVGDTSDAGRAPANTKSKGSWCETVANLQKQPRCFLANPISQSSSTGLASPKTTFYLTAARMFRCCGGGSSAESSTGPTTNNNTTASDKIGYEHPQPFALKTQPQCEQIFPTHSPREYFRALMKIVKGDQQNALLNAVKSRVDPTAMHQSRCILVSPVSIYNEKPYVIAYRLFFWSGLRDASELKRLPVCPSEHDPKYVCCNPLHWSRILETEKPHQSYQRLGMERLTKNGETSDYTGNSTTASVGSSNSNSNCDKRNQMQSDIYVQIPESFTTEGEDQRSWCQVAYWELNERVGSLCRVEKPTVNIYAEGPCSSGLSEEMCLKELAKKKPTTSPVGVEHIRQKIGLGVILSQESDGVWLYNRSTAPIFVYSPTLGESLSCVYKVSPGDCLKAFDSHRAQSLVYSSQFLGAATGPINIYSMCISFAKGWGVKYKRTNLFSCPCWLEVLFSQR